jgi:hypothetical protein
MGDNSLGISIGIGHIVDMLSGVLMLFHRPPYYPKTINNSFTQSTIHVTVELEHLAWGTIPSALASATSLDMPSGVPMLFHWPPHYTK